MQRTLLATLFACAAVLLPLSAHAEERLVMAPYPGPPPWHVVTNVTTAAGHLREQIPVDQKIEAYRDILTDQLFAGPVAVSPSEFLRGMFGRVSGACEAVRVNGPVDKVEDGHPVAYAQIYCGHQIGSETGANMFFKVIKGPKALYVIQREFRVPPTKTAGVMTFDKAHAADGLKLMKAQATADAYLGDSVVLCGDGSTDARCR